MLQLWAGMLGPFSSRRRRVICGVVAVCLWRASPGFAQSAENVAVVINDNSPESQRIGEHYARTRSLPPGNVLRIRVSTQETVERGVYASLIEGPIAAAIRRAGLQDRILYLVLTKGVPLRIAGTTGLNGTLSSVDAELTLLYRRMTGEAVPVAGKIDNPYFLGSRDLREALPFSHREHDIYLVTRIDAFTVDQALALIDKAQTTTATGHIVLDQREDDPTKAGNQWMAQAARRLAEQGHGSRVVLETTAAPAKVVGSTLGFYSWSAADPEYRRRTTGLTFATGSIAANLAGFDARTFLPPPDNWVPTSSGDPATFFAGTPDALIGDLIREGVTGVAGQVGEPLLLGAVRPDVLFPAYLAGYNLAEAFYLATPTLSWTTIVVGDPLCRPFTGRVLTSSDLDSAIDKETDLPKLFSTRRLARAVAGTAGVPQSAAVLAVRAETLVGEGRPRRCARRARAGGRDRAFGHRTPHEPRTTRRGRSFCMTPRSLAINASSSFNRPTSSRSTISHTHSRCIAKRRPRECRSRSGPRRLRPGVGVSLTPSRGSSTYWGTMRPPRSCWRARSR